MSVRSKKHLSFFVLWVSLVLAAALVPRPADGQQPISKSASPEVAQQVKAIFTGRCFQCHGLNGKAAKNIFALDRVRLIQTRVVIPGDVESPLLKAVESGAMPSGGPELSAADKAAVREWILSGAPDWGDQNSGDAEHRAFISESSLPRGAGGASAQNEAIDLLRSARTMFFRSDTVYLPSELVENALRGRADFQALDIAIVKKRDAADLVVDLNRPLFTFDFTWSVMHRQTSVLVAIGKVTAFNGNGAAPKIAKELIKQMKSARAPR